MFCYMCNKMISNDYKFCPQCGTKLKDKHDFSEFCDWLNTLYSGIDPTTGELFGVNEIKYNENLCTALKMLVKKDKSSKCAKRLCNNSLNRNVDEIKELLTIWNIKNQNVLSDSLIDNISMGDICDKDDLYEIPDMKDNIMKLYGEDIINILKPFINSFDKDTYNNLLRSEILIRNKIDYVAKKNAGKAWTIVEDLLLMTMMNEKRNMNYFETKLGRSCKSIIIRLVINGYFNNTVDAQNYFDSLDN